MYKIAYAKSVSKFIVAHPIEGVKLIEQAELIANSPFPLLPNTRPMVGKANQFRIRLGKYRVLYRVIEDNKIVFFLKANSRGDIYK